MTQWRFELATIRDFFCTARSFAECVVLVVFCFTNAFSSRCCWESILLLRTVCRERLQGHHLLGRSPPRRGGRYT